MEPKTKMQREVFSLYKKMPQITKAQEEYAKTNCFNSNAHRTKKGIITCLECGHQWKSEHHLAESICGVTCPHCGRQLEILDTRKRVFKEVEYFSIITTCKQYQVIRFFYIKKKRRLGEQAEYDINEVVQRWIAPNGKTETIARLRAMNYWYYDVWSLSSQMEIRTNNQHRAYDIRPYVTYPHKRIIPEIKRNGYTGKTFNILPFDLFTAILKNSKQETLLKAGQIDILEYSIHTSFNIDAYWNSIKICIRNGYKVKDASMWKDYIDLLRFFGKDTSSPKYVCPANLKAEHDRLVRKKREHQEREKLAKAREKAIKDEQKYKELKGKFFGISFTDGIIQVRVLESVNEFAEEGIAMHHCVFQNEYYLKNDSLILSATINGERVETVEVSLKSKRVVQSRGVCNSNTEYHDRIVALVNNNIHRIISVV